jgi:2-polyprenyl-6-methoxyphenol hydroxylase-like FAD-dependent oxidoreductase
MHDAMALANLIYAMPTRTSEDITRVFEEYKSERYPAAMDSYKNSKMMGKLIDSGFAGSFSLFLMTKMPQWMWRLVVMFYLFSCCFGIEK